VLRLVARSTRLLAILIALELLAGVVGVIGLSISAAPHPMLQPLARPALNDRAAAVQELLDERSAAVTTHDRDRWLATVDPRNTAFRAQQARLFDALQAVPIQDWRYDLDPSVQQPVSKELDRKRGHGWWVPGVTLHYRLAGFDTVPTAEPERLTFVPYAGRWYLTADDDAPDAAARDLWDGGPVVVVRGKSSLVLGHPDSRHLLRTIADGIDAAVPRVTSVWGSAWTQKAVVLVPSSQEELQQIIGGDSDFSRIAAVATAGLSESRAVGDRIVVNPPNFAKLGSLGRRVVHTHELTHIPTRAATGAATPTWLVEGFADYVGYFGIDLPYRVTAQELRAQVRRGRVPDTLPSNDDFAGSNPELAPVYEQAWLAATLLARRYGRDGLVRFYRSVGSGRTTNAALQKLFHTDLDAFTRSWRRDLQTRLG
jgi:hypothetical protein